jgi:hypothetical protein
VAEIENLSKATAGIFVFELTDEKLFAIAHHLPNLRYLIADGNTRVTDRGLHNLERFSILDSLDLEWSKVTNAGLPRIAAVKSLRWIDLGFCEGITREGASELKRMRPDLEAIFAWI